MILTQKIHFVELGSVREKFFNRPHLKHLQHAKKSNSLIWCFFGKKGSHYIVILGKRFKNIFSIGLYSIVILTQKTKLIDLGADIS